MRSLPVLLSAREDMSAGGRTDRQTASSQQSDSLSSGFMLFSSLSLSSSCLSLSLFCLSLSVFSLLCVSVRPVARCLSLCLSVSSSFSSSSSCLSDLPSACQSVRMMTVMMMLLSGLKQHQNVVLQLHLPAGGWQHIISSIWQ